MRLPRPSRDSLSPRQNNTSRTFSLIEDAFLTPNIMEESVEPDRQLNLVKLSEDGPKNLSRLFSDLSTILRPMLTLRILKI